MQKLYTIAVKVAGQSLYTNLWRQVLSLLQETAMHGKIGINIFLLIIIFQIIVVI